MAINHDTIEESPRSRRIQRDYGSASLSIAQGGTASGSIDLRATPNVCFAFPADMDGSQVSFELSFDDGDSWADLVDAAGDPLVQVFVASAAFALPPEAAGAHLVRLVSDVAESSARTIKVTTKG